MWEGERCLGALKGVGSGRVTPVGGWQAGQKIGEEALGMGSEAGKGLPGLGGKGSNTPHLA